MSTEIPRKAVEKGKKARSADPAIAKLNNEIDALKKALLSQSGKKEQSLADSMFAHLANNMTEGVLAENERHEITSANHVFCKLFEIDVPGDTLTGTDFKEIADQLKHLVKSPDGFSSRIDSLQKAKKSVLKEELELKNGKVYTFDFIPVFSGKEYKGNLWKYADVTRDKSTQQTLDAQKKFYEQILNHIPADIAVFSKEHKYLFLNSLAESDPEVRKWVTGKNDLEYFEHTGRPLSDAEGRRKLFSKVKLTKKQAEWEEKVPNPDGSSEYYLRKMYPVTGENGSLEMVIGCGQNITSLKKTEEHLHLSEKRYREIFSYSQAWICTHDLNGVILTINPAACEILGYEESELVGISIDILMPDKLRSQFHDVYLEKIRTDGKSEGVMTILNSEGKTVYLLYHNYQVNEPGAEPYVIGFAQNITERLQAEEALKKSEEKYRGIIENMNIGMLEIDNNEQIIYANQRFCAMSGYLQDELIARDARRMFQSENTRSETAQRQFSINNSYELSVKTKKGEPKWWLVSNAPLYNDDGSQRGSISIHLDITSQKKMEQQLREAKLEAERSSDSKEMFLTNMSHEIRTPINAIMGLGKLLEKSELDEQQRYYLTSIRAASENLLVIINDILDLSKIEAGKISLENMPFDLKKITGQAINMLTYKAEEKGLVLSHEIDSNIASKLFGDPFRINQVLINMLSNAIKFTEKGSVDLKASLREEADNHQRILITIKDTGVGISEEFIENIFKKFTQEDETIARKFGGTGLGMSITKQLMELMGGSIHITSKKDVGTIISLEFRFKIGTERVLEKKKAINKVDTSTIRNKRILLVEDNELNRLLAFTILKQYGAIVEEAENGAIAVDMVRNNKFDVVLMDVQMPVMDGVTATKIIRSEISSTIPIIALTANAIKGKKEQYIQSGMNDCITKPYDEEKMITLLCNWINNTAELVFEPVEIPIVEHKVVQLLAVEEADIAEETEEEGEEEAENAEEADETETFFAEAPPVRHEAKHEPLFNVKKLQDIGGGNNDFIINMLKLFVNDAPQSTQKIKEAYLSGDYETLKYLTHRIRPSLHNMSINTLKHEALEIEKMAENAEKTPALEKMIDNMVHVVNEVVVQLRKEYDL